MHNIGAIAKMNSLRLKNLGRLSDIMIEATHNLRNKQITIFLVTFQVFKKKSRCSNVTFIFESTTTKNQQTTIQVFQRVIIFSTTYNFRQVTTFSTSQIFCDELQLSASYHFRRRSTVRQTETAELLRLHRLLRRNRDDGSEGPRLPDCQVGQDFGVQLHVATVQRLAHVPSVVAVFGRGRVDSCNNKINFDVLYLITVCFIC